MHALRDDRYRQAVVIPGGNLGNPAHSRERHTRQAGPAAFSRWHVLIILALGVTWISGKGPEPFRYRSLGQLVGPGEGSALTNILGVKFSGLLGALVWRGVYLYELGYDLNRLQVLFDWVADLFFRPNTSKVFEDGGANDVLPCQL